MPPVLYEASSCTECHLSIQYLGLHGEFFRDDKMGENEAELNVSACFDIRPLAVRGAKNEL